MAQIEEQKIDTYDGNIAEVKAGIPKLSADGMKEGQILRNVVISSFVEHKTANEHKDEQTGELKKYKESWTFLVDYDHKQWYLRLGAKNIVAIREELKWGNNVNQWVGKTLELVVKQYGTGIKGFGVCI